MHVAQTIDATDLDDDALLLAYHSLQHEKARVREQLRLAQRDEMYSLHHGAELNNRDWTLGKQLESVQQEIRERGLSTSQPH